jgi:dTDP-4-amino-4,6-dideoxygalactose transaminase
VDRTGFKYNLGDIQSALGLVQLRRSVELLDRRRHIAEAYDEAFADLDAIISPAHVPGHAWHLYVVRLDPSKTSLTRNDLIAGLNERGIGTSVHFIPIHRLGYYAEKYADSLGPLPVADEAFERIVSLPIYPAMTDVDVAAVIDAVHDVTRRDS